MKKVGIATVTTGYNFGSSLQAAALKKVLNVLGYNAEILSISGSVVNGRDIRIEKLLGMATKILLHPQIAKKVFKTYKDSISKPLTKASMEKFREFSDEKLCVKGVTYSKLRKVAKSNEYYAFVCGSDQVWNATAVYVDKFYYLRFAPRHKRIAYAPSLGKDIVPNYNKKKLRRYISEIPMISVREDNGADIIRELTGRQAEVMLDPTLLMTKEQWNDLIKDNATEKGKYILSYFLDEPSELAKRAIEELATNNNCKILEIPYTWIGNAKIESGIGPVEFVNLVKNASWVCTDSFHGTAFSVNFNVPFYVFERNYGMAEKQSARILSLLNKVGLMDCYITDRLPDINDDITFEQANIVLERERQKAVDYLKRALKEDC